MQSKTAVCVETCRIQIYEQISAQLTITENHPHFINSKILKVSYRNALTWGDNLHRGVDVNIAAWQWKGSLSLF